MKAEELKPQVIRPERVVTPQCSVPINDPSHAAGWRKERYTKLRPTFDPNRCQRESVYRLDGKCFCKEHAGIYTLAKWNAGELYSVEGIESHPAPETPTAGHACREAALDEAIDAVKGVMDPQNRHWKDYPMVGPIGIIQGCIAAIRSLKRS